MTKVLVTGGSGCLGKSIVRGLALDGFDIIFTSTSANKACSFIAELKDDAVDVSRIQYQLATFNGEEDIDKFIDEVTTTHEITHLVNNARSINNLSMVDGVPSAESMVGEYFMSCVVSYKLALGFKSTLKSVVNITSMYGIVAPNKELYLDDYQSSPTHYGVSKAAQIQLTKEMAVRFSKDRINVNCISFGGFEGRVDEGFLERYGKLCPSERMLKVSEAYAPVKFLLEAPHGTITGHNLVVDGGWSVW